VKTYIIAFLCVLAISCWLNDSGGGEKSEMESGVANSVARLPEPTSKEEFQIQEVQVTDKSRSTNYADKVIDDKGFSENQFPYRGGAL